MLSYTFINSHSQVSDLGPKGPLVTKTRMDSGSAGPGLINQSERKTVWILIRWLLQKPADQDSQCFQKIRMNPGSAGQGLNPGMEPEISETNLF